MKKKRVFKRIKRIIKLMFKTCLIMSLVFLIMGVIIGAVVYVKMKPILNEAKETSYDKLSSITDNTFKKLSDTVIYDKDGKVLSEINIGNYKYVEIKDVSKWVQEGYIAVEDRNFKTHNGIDYKALLRAGVALIKNKGNITQGGSTITQQVIKNNLLTQEQTFERKFIEFFLAPELEKEYSKQKILEFYVNTNFYGNNCYGIETASLYYFNVPSKDLSLAQAALLVGLSNNPARYNPIKHPEDSKVKRDFVLGQMYDFGTISEEEYKSALKEEVVLTLEKEHRTKESYQVSYGIYCATLKLMELQGFKFEYVFKDKADYEAYKEKYNTTYTELANEIRTGGYKIYTSLDSSKQKLLQKAVDSNLKGFMDKAEDGRYAMQGAAVAVDNKTGYVIAIVGGRGINDEYNRGYLSLRQPGSSIKPLIVYGPAIDSGKYYPSKQVVDEKVENGPNNAGGGYRGALPLREALARSLNTVAFKIFTDMGADTGLSYLEKLRFSGLTYVDNGNNAMALGGFTYGARVWEMAKAYSTIANYGEYSDRTCITKIEYQGDGVLYDGETKYTQVYDADAAYLLMDCMKGVFEESYGTAHDLQIEDVITAGKTGTTTDGKDGWFCGFSKYYTVAVWCGYDTPKSLDSLYGATYPGSIWKDFMTALHKGKKEVDFTRPVTVTEMDIDWRGELVDYNSWRKDLFSQHLLDKAKGSEKETEKDNVSNNTSNYYPKVTPKPTATSTPTPTATPTPEPTITPIPTEIPEQTDTENTEDTVNIDVEDTVNIEGTDETEDTQVIDDGTTDIDDEGSSDNTEEVQVDFESIDNELD